MARLELFAVSHSVAIDQATNNASILEVLEVLSVDSFPALIPQCAAMSLWRREPGDEEEDFQLEMKITTPSGNEHSIRTNFRFPSPRHRVVQRLVGIELECEGQLRFEVVLNGEHAAEHVVDIVLGEGVPSTQLTPTP